MTKVSKSVVAPVLPTDIIVTGTMINAMLQACVHMRQGYMPSATIPMQVFPSAGTVTIHLTIGCPDQFFVDKAIAEVTVAAEREHAVFLRLVEEAATRQLEDAERAKREAKLVLLRAEQKAQIAALEASIASL